MEDKLTKSWPGATFRAEQNYAAEQPPQEDQQLTQSATAAEIHG